MSKHIPDLSGAMDILANMGYSPDVINDMTPKEIGLNAFYWDSESVDSEVEDWLYGLGYRTLMSRSPGTVEYDAACQMLAEGGDHNDSQQ